MLVGNKNFTNISVIENFILGGAFTPSVLGKNLQQLRDARKTFYNNLFDELASGNYRNEFYAEYKNYCDFNRDLICSNKLPNAIFCRLLDNFLNDYDIVKPVDNDKFCYKTTLDTLDSVGAHVINSNNAIKNYQLSGIRMAKDNFIEDNEPSEPLIK